MQALDLTTPLAIILGISASLVTLLAAVVFFLYLPANYFQQAHADRWHQPLFWLGQLLGLILVIAGIAMLFLPGQGVLTILMGLCFMEFPGKQKLMKKLLATQGLKAKINKLRTRFGRPEFIF